MKDSIKNNPEKEVELGFIGNFPLFWKNDGTKFDEFVENCYKYGLIDDNARMVLEYYSAEEKNKKSV